MRIEIKLKLRFHEGKLSYFLKKRSIVCISAPSFVLSLFTEKDEIINTGAAYLSILAFSFLPFTITQTLVATARSDENPRIGTYISLVSLSINVALNYLLIYGKFGFPALGVRGAALATVISRVVECAVIVLYTFIFEKRLMLSHR